MGLDIDHLEKLIGCGDVLSIGVKENYEFLVGSGDK
jgi:hypothetical protein